MSQKQLQRTLGFWDVLMFGVGGIVGAGIYAIIGQAAELSGNLLWLSFIVAAVVALLTGLSYAEFVSRYPDAGGSFEYIKRGLGNKIALFMSVFMVFTGIVAAAAIAISFSEYLSRLWEIPKWSGVVGSIVLMALFNIVGSKQSSYYNSVATIITLAGLLLVVAVSLPDFAQVELFKVSVEGGALSSVMAGGALIFFSYIGFEDLVKMAEETKQPSKNLPKAVLLSGLIVLVVYVLIAISSLSVLGADKLASSNGPLASVIEQKLGQIGATILVVVALFATSKTILSNILGTSRLLYDIARDSQISWLKSFTTISGIGNTPNYAIVSIAAVAIGFGLIGDLKMVASISNIFIFIVFGMVNVALLNYRLKHKGSHDSNKDLFKIPFNIWHIPIPTVVALLTLLVLFAYNMLNLING